jgi:hypothetical protein
MKKIIASLVVLAVIAAGVFSLSSSSDDTGLEISTANLLDLLYNYEGTGRKPNTPLTLVAYDKVKDGTSEYTEVVYGHGVEKGDKKDVGYEINTTSPHGYFFVVSHFTSTQAGLYYVDKGDAERFFERVAKEQTVLFNGKTFNVVTKPDDKRLYLTTPWGNGKNETRFAIFPPVEVGDFYYVEVEIYA